MMLREAVGNITGVSGLVMVGGVVFFKEEAPTKDTLCGQVGCSKIAVICVYFDTATTENCLEF